MTVLPIPYNLVLDKNVQQFIIKKLDDVNVSCGIFADFTESI